MSTQYMSRYVPLVQTFAARLLLFHDAVARKLNLHLTDVKVIRLLGDKEMTPGDLVEHTGLTGASITAVVDRLEKAGYVTRKRDEEDRRRVTVRAVPAKVRKLDAAYAGIGAEMSNLLSKYDDAEFAVITDYLSRATETLARQTRKLRNEEAPAFK
jgi:DNA-binding MarR family transcriptional regulator